MNVYQLILDTCNINNNPLRYLNVSKIQCCCKYAVIMCLEMKKGLFHINVYVKVRTMSSHVKMILQQKIH